MRTAGKGHAATVVHFEPRSTGSTIVGSQTEETVLVAVSTDLETLCSIHQDRVDGADEALGWIGGVAGRAEGLVEAGEASAVTEEVALIASDTEVGVALVAVAGRQTGANYYLIIDEGH